MVVLAIVCLAVGSGIGYFVALDRFRGLNEDLDDLNAQVMDMTEQLDAIQVNLTEKESLINLLESEKELLRSELETSQSNIQELRLLAPPSKTLAPDFTVRDIDGELFTLSEHRGEIVLIDFMTTWCEYCDPQILQYSTLFDKFGEHIVAATISVDPLSDSEEELMNYRDSFNASWVWALDTNDVYELFHVRSLPTTVIIDRNGYVWAKHVGFSNATTLMIEIEQLLSYWGDYEVPESFVTVSAIDAKGFIGMYPDIVILDVRTEEEFNVEHLEDAINIPLQDLPWKFVELDKKKTILVYCKNGNKSAQASQTLVNNGFSNIYHLEGGITSWKNEHFPIVIVP